MRETEREGVLLLGIEVRSRRLVGLSRDVCSRTTLLWGRAHSANAVEGDLPDRNQEATLRALFAGLALALSLPFSAQAMQDADREAIQWVVKREIKALQRDHAAAAYSFVSPSAHRLFPSQEEYMAKMLENFPGIAYATSFELGELKETSKGLAQMVTLVDRRGQPHIAFFFMEKNEQIGWSIHNFFMVPLKVAAV